MQTEPTPENTLKQINESYRLLDDLFHILDTSNDIDTEHHKYLSRHLEEVIRLLKWSESYAKARG